MPADDLARRPSTGDETDVIIAEIVDADEPTSDTGVIEVEPERRTSRIPGVVALLLALATAVVGFVAVGLATAGDDSVATVLGYVAIGMSIGAMLLGLVAAIAGWGRRWALVGVLLGIAANPWVQLVVLRFLAGE